MFKSLKILFLILICFVNGYVFADTGCMLPGGQIYSPKTGTALLGATLVPLSLGITVNLYASPEVSNMPSTCPGWATNIIGTGNKCATTTLLGVGLLGGYLLATNSGDEVTYDFVDCNLDTYSWLFGLGAGAFGLVIIRKRKDHDHLNG